HSARRSSDARTSAMNRARSPGVSTGGISSGHAAAPPDQAEGTIAVDPAGPAAGAPKMDAPDAGAPEAAGMSRRPIRIPMAFARPIHCADMAPSAIWRAAGWLPTSPCGRSEEHTSELQSPCNLVCRLLLEKKKKKKI